MSYRELNPTRHRAEMRLIEQGKLPHLPEHLQRQKNSRRKPKC